VIGKGFVFEIPEDAEGQRAARQLTRVMLLQYLDLPGGGCPTTSPHLSLEWVRAAGQLHVRLVVTPDELREIQEALEQLLEPFLKHRGNRAQVFDQHLVHGELGHPDPLAQLVRQVASSAGLRVASVREEIDGSIGGEMPPDDPQCLLRL
jgi:hypothetical protein